jgi:hypothetical protein
MSLRAQSAALVDKWIARHGASAPSELRRCAADPHNSPDVKRLLEDAAHAAEQILAEKPAQPERASGHSRRGHER